MILHPSTITPRPSHFSQERDAEPKSKVCKTDSGGATLSLADAHVAARKYNAMYAGWPDIQNEMRFL